MTNRFSVIGILMVTLAAARPSSANECFEAELCERVNGDVDVFVGKILTEIDDDGAVRVHVVRSFKGSAKDDIPVVVIPIGLLGLPSYEIGESYLFYASKASDNGVTTRHAGGCAGAAKLKEVGREELSFLEGLGLGKQTGDVFGVVVREGNFDERIRDLQVILTGGGRRYSSKTDRDGNFRLTDVAPGTYNFVFDGPYDDILLQADENIEITPHGCFEATVLASHNATIGGRVVLPTGFSVDGLVVNAFTLDGREAAEAFADKDGRYIIVGIKPGDYLVGINAGRFPPTPDRPFSPTYAPSAIEPQRASRVHIETGTHLRDVDIWVNNASPLATLTVHATFDDGEPVDDVAFSLSFRGGQFGTGRIENTGAATMQLVRGVRATLVGRSKTKDGQWKCATPLVLGPADYPERLDVTLSDDGCRRQANFEYFASFQAGHTEPFEPLLVVALHPNSAPVYRAEVFVSQPPHFFTGGFQTDENGAVEVLAPLEGNVSLHAGVLPVVFPNPQPRCRTEDVTVTRDHARWRYSSDPSTWHDASEPVVLRLSGPDCLH